MNNIVVLLLPLFFAANAFAQSPIRLGMGLSQDQLPAFTDEALLTSIKKSVESSNVSPIFTIKVGVVKDRLSVIVQGEKQAQFLCSPESCDRSDMPASSQMLIAQTEIPFGNVKAYGFKGPKEAFELGTTGWIAVSAVAYYLVKKGINRILTKKWLANTEEHSHFFMSPEEMREDMQLNQKIVERAEVSVERDIQEIAAPLIKVAACGHHHGHDHRERFHCEGVSEEQVAEAQRTLLGKVPHYAAVLLTDFYREVLAPMVDAIRAVMDPFNRRQLYSFAELVSLRMLKERGTVPAITSIAFIATSQAIYETFESYVTPAHFACAAGNVAILGVAATAYTVYNCLRETAHLKGMSIMDRLRIAARVSRVNWRASRGLEAKSEGFHEGEKSALAMNVIFRLVERDVRHARDLDKITRHQGRELARELGELKKELNSLAIKSAIHPLPMDEVHGWIYRLAQIRNKAIPVQMDTRCENFLSAVAS